MTPADQSGLAPTIAPLTALRFFAAAAIVVHHSLGILLPSSTFSGVPLDSGVSFFFVLSGFILAYVYGEDLRGAGAFSFYRARFARVWPMTAFTGLAVVVLLPSGMYLPSMTLGWPTVGRLIAGAAYILLVQAWIPVPAFYFSYNAPAWSVSNEVFFYLLFPLLVRGVRRNWMVKLGVVLMVGFAFVLLAERAGPAAYSPHTLGVATLHGFTYINPLARLKEFAIGVVLGVLYVRLRALGLGMRRGVATTAELLVVATLPFVLRRIPAIRFGLLPSASPAAAMYLDQTLMAVLFGAVVMVFAFSAGQVSRILATRPVVLLGEVSFSLYLVHQPLLNLYQRHLGSFAWRPTWLLFALGMGAMLLVSAATWRFVEVPARTLLRSGRRRPVTAP